jgi:class 3 adenylate cyclase/CHASE2 domain-containing sensor protein
VVATPSGNDAALRWRWLAAVAVILAVFHFAPLGPSLDRAFHDFSVQHPLRRPVPPPGSALVLIDATTMQALSEQGLGGAWPPPRATFAALIAGLVRSGADRVVLDLEFLDHSSAAEQDALLGSISAAAQQVVLARSPRQPPVFWDDAFCAAHPALFATPRTGLALGQGDDDGVIRRYEVPGSLAGAARPSASNARGGLLRWYGGVGQLRRAGGTVPVLSAARFIVAGLPSVTRIAEAAPDLAPEPVGEALRREPPLTGPGFDEVRGRVVFVGANTEGTFDQKPFAIGGLEPGVLVHWTAWANLAGGGFVRELARGWSLVLAAVVVGLLAWVGSRRRELAWTLGVAGMMVLGLLVISYAGLAAGWYLAPATPVAAAFAGLLGVTAESYWLEQRRRREVQLMFGSYVDPEVVELLVRDPAAIRLGGERREATVFFCDLAGFTHLSEEVPPDQLLMLVNGYLQQTSDCLLEHGAYIDKYIGDAVMAVFGAPKPLPRHPLAACRGALAAQKLLAERNQQLAERFGRTLGMRIGINSGEMIVGNLGSERKRNYTVLGDAVNLASRLEGANKEFGTSILLSDATARAVENELIVRPLTALRVKGKNTAIPVFELVGEPGSISPEHEAFLRAYAEGHRWYTTRRFAEAEEPLQRALALRPSDPMTQALLNDSRQLAVHPPPADWQPILSLQTK